MKLALLGSGKTGHFVTELEPNTTVFNSKNPPSLVDLKSHDVIICFLTGETFHQYIPLLIESQIKVVSGSTGHSYPDDFDRVLQEKQLTWIYAHNFSLSMALVKSALQELGKIAELIEDTAFAIEETHHVHKKDAPSGTALSWKSWLGREAEMTSLREGDVIGFHKLTIQTEDEEIKLQHNAKSRSLFARGALWAANRIEKVPSGLHEFQDVVQSYLKERI